jgi:hypothetical protein
MHLTSLESHEVIEILKCFYFPSLISSQNLVLKNGTKSLDWWIESPLKPLIKVHIFNYTNIEDVLAGRTKKIKVNDVGPFVYEDKLQRVKLEYLDGNKISFYVRS